MESKCQVKARTAIHTLTSKFLVFFQKLCVFIFVYISFSLYKQHCYIASFHPSLNFLATWKSHLVLFNGCCIL